MASSMAFNGAAISFVSKKYTIAVFESRHVR